MKLAAIFNVWHDWDMLQYSAGNIESLVDGIIVIGSEFSNYGEQSPIPKEWLYKVIVREPKIGRPPMENETMKRNYGLEIARKAGYTHFIMMDADEFYNPLDLRVELKRFKHNEHLNGLVCASRVYFKSPHLTIGLDTTLVPFIHKITPGLQFGINKNYPFAWDKGAIRIDPTRQLSYSKGIEWSPIIMEHYSWVRSDIEIKIRNSSARANLERSTIREDYALAKETYFCKFYGRTLIRASVDFNIPEFNVSDIQPLASETGKTPGNT